MLINELNELRHELISEQSVLVGIIDICKKESGCLHQTSIQKILKGLNFHMDRTVDQLLEVINDLDNGDKIIIREKRNNNNTGG